VRLVVSSARVPIKGSLSPITVYTLAPATEFSSMGLLEVVHGPNHMEQIHQIEDHIRCRERAAVIVTGPPLSGKKIACQQAAGFAGTVPYLHVCTESLGMLQLARTIASWFKYANVQCIQDASFSILRCLDDKHWSLAHDEAVDLVHSAIKHGMSGCFVVDRVQALDSYSVSLIRECLHHKPRMKGSLNQEAHECAVSAVGRVSFLCVHVPTFRGKSASDLAVSLARLNRSVEIPVIEVNQSSVEDIRKMCLPMNLKGSVIFDNDYYRVITRDSGFCSGMCIERIVLLEVCPPGAANESQFTVVFSHKLGCRPNRPSAPCDGARANSPCRKWATISSDECLQAQ
jgi:hypothetical protein